MDTQLKNARKKPERTTVVEDTPGVKIPEKPPRPKPITAMPKKTERTTLEGRKKQRKENRVVPRELKILLKETKNAQSKKYRSFVLRERRKWGEKSAEAKVAELT